MTLTYEAPGATLAYDVRGPLPPADLVAGFLALSSWSGQFPAGFVPDAAITGYRPDFAALGEPLAVFPSHHGGFLGGELGQQGEPEAFAARLHELLGA